MPVSLEQWRGSVGMINAGRSRALAKCIKGSPRSGSNLDLILFLLVMAPLVMCCCVGAWLVVKWGAPVKHGQLLKRYRREDALRQCLLLGTVCCEGWLLSLQCVHGERVPVWPHENHHMTCLSESSHYLSSLSSSGCGQYLNIVFHTVMVTLLYLCGDVEKNPGPPFELVPGNVDKLCALLEDVDYYLLVATLKDGLNVPLNSTEKLTASEFRLEMLSWLKREKLKPPWSEMTSALLGIGRIDIVIELGAEGLQSTATGVTRTIAAAGREPAGCKEYHGHKEDSPNLETIDESSFDRDDDFADIVEAVESLAADWDKLAIKLHVKNDNIKVIRKDNPGDSQGCLHDALALWLKENYNTERFGHPSWRTLVEAVVKMDNALACKIANEHREGKICGNTETRMDSSSQNADSTDDEVTGYLFSFGLNSSPHLDETLDWDNEGVEKDLIEIAKHLTGWEEKLVSPLELTHTEVSDIEKKHPREPALQRREVLRVWKSKNGLRATYKNLLGKFITAEHEGAKAVCEVLQKKASETEVSSKAKRMKLSKK